MSVYLGLRQWKSHLLQDKYGYIFGEIITYREKQTKWSQQRENDKDMSNQNLKEVREVFPKAELNREQK
jgi:hypothetical protein